MTENLMAFLTLTLMEIVLGIDNIIFIAIIVSRLPKEFQFRARAFGLFIALFIRILLLMSLNWVMGLTAPIFEVFAHSFSGKDLLMLGGGLFLIYKATSEIHQKMTAAPAPLAGIAKPSRKILRVILEISAIDVVFSLDSIITAVGMTRMVGIMISAVIVSMFVMIAISGKIADFIEKNPTIKILSLAFLIMIGVMLLMEGMTIHAPRGYLYFAMFFSLGVEILNMNYRKRNS